MAPDTQPHVGVVITGPFGTGKSTAAEEIATRLEMEALPYAAIDLDWLCWFDAGGDDEAAERVMLQNLAGVLENYLAGGVRFFVFAGTIRNQVELDRIREVVPFPLTVVGLMAPWAEVERRLSQSPTSGRRDDLRRAKEQFASSEPGPTVDVTIESTRPVDAVAAEILRSLGWLE